LKNYSKHPNNINYIINIDKDEIKLSWEIQNKNLSNFNTKKINRFLSAKVQIFDITGISKEKTLIFEVKEISIDKLFYLFFIF
jgi:hypothetical protein